MKSENKIRRREFLKYSALSATGFLAPPFLISCEKETQDGKISSVKNSHGNILDNFSPDYELQFTAESVYVQILNGNKTKVWRIKGELMNGSPNVMQYSPDSYFGPIIRIKKGEKIRIHFKNELDEQTIIHWHGLHVPEKADGHPRFVISKGDTYTYEFEVNNRNGTYWFHPHPHGRTGPQVYYGMAGLFIVSDEEEQKLELPVGEYDIPIIIQDKTFDGNNQLIYMNNMMDKMSGFLGNNILVNGGVNYELNLATRIYRLRLLNASNSRIYKLAWSDGTPLTIIGTDGGLLEEPVQRPYLIMGVGERYDIWVDFSKKKTASEFVMKSLPFSFDMGGNGGMMNNGIRRGMMGNNGMKGKMMNSSIPNGSEFDVFKIKITKNEKENLSLPAKLSRIDWLDKEDAINIEDPRTFKFFMQNMQWTINGRTFQMTDVADDEKVKLNTTEVWQIINESGSGMGMMGQSMLPHPFHIHSLQFQIIERNTENVAGSIWESIKDGFVDNGLKDTTLIFPGMELKILQSFIDYTGLFLYHCHNLEHEDMGMMRNFLIS